ncbi:MAG: zinc ribbon domain-containing protein [Coprobacillus sp.]
MKKCPRCDHELKDEEKYCPHCGLDLNQNYRPIKKQKNKPMTYLLYVIVFFSFITIPLLYSRLLDGIGGGMTQPTETEKIELKEVQKTAPSSIAASYSTLADYDKQFTNVSSAINGIQEYEKQLSLKGDYQYDKIYQIRVLDNYDVYYSMRYTAKINDDLSIVIEKEFNRGHTFNDEKITFRKNNVSDFDGLIFTSEQMDIVKPYTKDVSIVEKLMNDFTTRQDEFEKKKEKLGHYGLGNYNGRSSFVAYRQLNNYYSELTYGETPSEYID